MPSYFVDKSGSVWEYDNARAGAEAGLEPATAKDIERHNTQLDYEAKSALGKAGDIATAGLQGVARGAMAPGMALQHALTGSLPGQTAQADLPPEQRSALSEGVFSEQAQLRKERHPFTAGTGEALPSMLAAGGAGGALAGAAASPLLIGGGLLGESALSGVSQEAVDSVTQGRDFSAQAALMNGGVDLAFSTLTFGLGHGLGKLAAPTLARRAAAEAGGDAAASGVRAVDGAAAAEAGIPKRNFISELDPGEVPEAIGKRPARSAGAASNAPERMPAAEVEHYLRDDEAIVDRMQTVAGGGEGEKGAFQDFNESFRDLTNNRVKREDFVKAAPTDEATRAALMAEKQEISDGLARVANSLTERGAKSRAATLAKHIDALHDAPVEEVAGMLDRAKQALDDLHMRAIVDKTDPYGEMLEAVDPVVTRIRGALENPRYVGDKIAELQQVRNSAWSDPANGFIRNMEIAQAMGGDLFKKVGRDYHTGDLVMQFDPSAFERVLKMNPHQSKPVLEAWAKVLDSAERMAANTVEAGVQSAGRASRGRLDESIKAIREVFTTQDKRLAARDLARPGQDLLARAEQLPGVGTAVKAAKGLFGKDRVEAFVAGRASGHVPLRQRSVAQARDELRRIGELGRKPAANDTVPPSGPRPTAAAAAPDDAPSIADLTHADLGADEFRPDVLERLRADETFAATGKPEAGIGRTTQGDEILLRRRSPEGKGPLKGEGMFLVDGSHRLQVAREKGLTHLPGVILDDAGNEVYRGAVRVGGGPAAGAGAAAAPGGGLGGALGGISSGKVAGVGGLLGAGALLASGEAQAATELPEQTQARQAMAAQLDGLDPDQAAVQVRTAEALARINQRVDTRVKGAVTDLFAIARDPKAPPPHRTPEARAIDRRARELDVPRAVARFMGRRDDPVQAWQDKRHMLTSVVQDPTRLASRMAENLGDLPTQQPEIFAKMVGQTMATVEYLHDKLPGASGKSALDPGGFPPSFEEITEFSGHWVGALYPLDSLDDLSTNELLPEQMEAVQALWPDGYARFQSAAMAQIHELSQAGHAIPLEALEQIDSALDLDGAGEPALSSAMAGLIRQAEQSEQQRLEQEQAKMPPPPGPQISQGPERLASSALGSISGAGE